MDHKESTVDRLLNARAEIDEKLREHKTALTVLFTDVVGSTEYFDRYGDTAGVAMLHRHAQLSSNTVAEFRGRVIKTIGDSIMAEFAEPAFGVRAAVEIQRRLARLNQTLPERERLELRIGLNHGPCYRHGNDVFGDAVNLAARITKKTGPAQILISHSVRDVVAIEPNVRCNWLGEITVKGKEEKENIYEVIWTDTATYSNLRQNLTGRFARGELISPGVRLEDIVQAVPSGTPAPVVEAISMGLSPAPEAVRDRYEILAEVGSGGMGIVYEARDRETNEIVALKVLRAEIAADSAAMERFKNELRLTRKITHKNVCRIHEFNRAGNTAYITMEFVAGESLRQRLNRTGKLPLEEGLQVAGQICAGVKGAHEQGIVHRDLKPENIMVDKTGTVKVMDFGIARLAGAMTTLAGHVFGTPAYMSPEQAEGKTADQRSDIYAMGLILYEIFTGRVAFKGDTPVAVALKQIRETPDRPTQHNASLPRHIERAILKCLEKHPANRFASVEFVEEALGDSRQRLPLDRGLSRPHAKDDIEPVRPKTPPAVKMADTAKPARIRLRSGLLYTFLVFLSAALVWFWTNHTMLQAPRQQSSVQGQTSKLADTPSQEIERKDSSKSPPTVVVKPLRTQSADVPASFPEPEVLQLKIDSVKPTRMKVTADGVVKFDGRTQFNQSLRFEAKEKFEVSSEISSAVLLELNGQIMMFEEPPDAPGRITLDRSKLKKDQGGMHFGSARSIAPPVTALEGTIGDLGVMSGPRARNEAELEVVKQMQKQWRQISGFALAMELVVYVGPGPIELRLTESDPATHRYSFEIVADGRTIIKKAKVLLEPVQFYVKGSRPPCEIVVYEIHRDRIVGYLSYPLSYPRE